MIGKYRDRAKKLYNLIVGLPIKTIIFIPAGLLVLIVVRLVKQVVLIRFGRVESHHIGHFALNTELLLCNKEAGINVPDGRYIDFMFIPPEQYVANKQLLKMWDRVIKIHRSYFFEAISILNAYIPGGNDHDLSYRLQNDRDVNNVLPLSLLHISFTDEEEMRGKKFLMSLGINEGDKFICLSVRDSSYYESLSQSDDRHKYRNSSIGDYLLMAEKLADMGFYIVRMGKKVKSPLVSSNEKIIDYAYSGIGDDFLDMYLGSKCYMCLSTGNGFDAIPALFRRPVSYVNCMPIDTPYSWRGNLVYLSKKHIHGLSGKELTLKQILMLRLSQNASTEKYNDNNIFVKDNAPEEILDVAVESIERIQGVKVDTTLDVELQETFKKILLPVFLVDTNGDNVSMHGEFCIRYSADYLKGNRWWLD